MHIIVCKSSVADVSIPSRRSCELIIMLSASSREQEKRRVEPHGLGSAGQRAGFGERAVKARNAHEEAWRQAPQQCLRQAAVYYGIIITAQPSPVQVPWTTKLRPSALPPCDAYGQHAGNMHPCTYNWLLTPSLTLNSRPCVRSGLGCCKPLSLVCSQGMELRLFASKQTYRNVSRFHQQNMNRNGMSLVGRRPQSNSGQSPV